MEKAFISSELEESMKIVKAKSDKPNNDETVRVFGLNFKQEKIDDDVSVWTQEQLKNQLIEKGVELLSEMGQDVQGNWFFVILNLLLCVIFTIFISRQ